MQKNEWKAVLSKIVIAEITFTTNDNMAAVTGVWCGWEVPGLADHNLITNCFLAVPRSVWVRLLSPFDHRGFFREHFSEDRPVDEIELEELARITQESVIRIHKEVHFENPIETNFVIFRPKYFPAARPQDIGVPE